MAARSSSSSCSLGSTLPLLPFKDQREKGKGAIFNNLRSGGREGVAWGSVESEWGRGVGERKKEKGGDQMKENMTNWPRGYREKGGGTTTIEEEGWLSAASRVA